MFGKLIITKRKVAWYGDMNFDYSYPIPQRKLTLDCALLELSIGEPQQEKPTIPAC
jgi:hypothetical protein